MSANGKNAQRWWIIGVIGLSFLVAGLPYWILNILNGPVLAAPWWRVPVGTPGVFDSYVYFNWMGATANGLPAGNLLSWYGVIVKIVWALMSRWASIPEMWIVTRWLSIALIAFIGSWSLRAWSGLDRTTARLVTCAYGAGIALSIGIRPGADSWYFPFALFAYAASAKTYALLRESKWVVAIVWSLLAIGASVLYPWYFMFVGLWLATMWGVALIRQRPAAFYVFLTVACLAIGLSANRLSRWFLDPARAGLIGVYERSGIVFAHVPFFANTLIASGTWIVLLFVLAFLYAPQDEIRRRLTRDAWAWIALTVLWFNTPFTGIHLYSDHFIATTVILTLFSLSTVWRSVRETVSRDVRPRLSALIRRLLVAMALGSSVFVLYIVQQPIRGNLIKFDSYAVHVIHWFVLSIAAWFAVIRVYRQRAPHERRAMLVLWIGCAVIGGWGMVSMIARDHGKMAGIEKRIPAITWIRSTVSASQTLCSDLESAAFYAGHTGLRVYPAEATLSYAIPNETVFQELETIAGAYDVVGSGNLDLYHFYTDFYRTIPCAAASKYSHNAFWDRTLRRFGITDASINELIGCRQEVIDANWSRISKAIEQHQINDAAFRNTCPMVIIPDEQKSYWTLPSDYREVWFGNGVGVWKATK